MESMQRVNSSKLLFAYEKLNYLVLDFVCKFWKKFESLILVWSKREKVGFVFLINVGLKLDSHESGLGWCYLLLKVGHVNWNGELDGAFCQLEVIFVPP